MRFTGCYASLAYAPLHAVCMVAAHMVHNCPKTSCAIITTQGWCPLQAVASSWCSCLQGLLHCRNTHDGCCAGCTGRHCVDSHSIVARHSRHINHVLPHLQCDGAGDSPYDSLPHIPHKCGTFACRHVVYVCHTWGSARCGCSHVPVCKV